MQVGLFSKESDYKKSSLAVNIDKIKYENRKEKMQIL